MRSRVCLRDDLAINYRATISCMNLSLTRGDVTLFRENVNSVLAILLIGSFSLGMLVIFWHVIDEDPLSDIMVEHAQALDLAS